MYCKFCGKKLPEKAIFCSKCGNQISIKQETEINNFSLSVSQPSKSKIIKNKYKAIDSNKSRLIAALLAFFLGELGAHRFYVGKVLSGLLQLFLGFSFITSLILVLYGYFEEAAIVYIVGILWSLWTFIDFILIICGSFTDSNGLPITDWDF